MKATDVLKALTLGPFPPRRWLMVPNVSWGWGLNYEADVIAIGKTGLASEIEIKVTKADFLRDGGKRKWVTGLDPRIQKFWFAVAPELESVVLEVADANHGVIVVDPPRNDGDHARARIVRPAQKLVGGLTRKPTEREVNDLLRLGCLRYWDLLLKTPAPEVRE